MEARTLGNPLGGVSGPPAGFRMADFQASTEQPGGRGDAEVQAGVGWLKAHHSLKARVRAAGRGLRVTGKKKAGSWPAP